MIPYERDEVAGVLMHLHAIASEAKSTKEVADYIKRLLHFHSSGDWRNILEKKVLSPPKKDKSSFIAIGGSHGMGEKIKSMKSIS